MKKAGRWELWVPTKGLLRTVLVVEGGGGLGAGKEEGLTFTQYLLWPGAELPRPGI